ncbi:MAG TPA: HNH endonuclease [Devosiaceae bacterium]
MTAKPVEWVLVIYYGPSAHRATYGRLDNTKYTKDYIQLSRKSDFLDQVTNLFPVATSSVGSVPLTYRWPGGQAPGALVFRSADRPHLKWETNLGAPGAWKMTPTPSEATVETIPGDPTRPDFDGAEEEFALVGSRGAGQPYLMAIKLRDEPRTLHLRVYLKNPSEEFAWADIQLMPQEIFALAGKTSQTSALAWSTFQSGGAAPTPNVDAALTALNTAEDFASVINTLDADTGQMLANYIASPAYGLFFDPTKNHDAWLQPAPLAEGVASSFDDILQVLKTRFVVPQQDDAVAETLDVSAEQVEVFREQIKKEDYEVADSHSTVKTRGSAQRAFADAVKGNYGFRCAITDIATKEFLVAAHIVPWSQDQTIRLDPSNGICLSLLMDRAFETGYLLIEDDLTVIVDWGKVGDDLALRSQLEPYDGKKISEPSHEAPRAEYLQRRRAMVIPKD